MLNLKLKLVVIFIMLGFAGSAQLIHHEITASLDIPGNSIKVSDQMTLPVQMVDQLKTISFSLNKNLALTNTNKEVIISGPQSAGDNVLFQVYTITLPDRVKEDLVIPIEYSGVINDQIKEGAAEYARGFSETTGIICEDGVYLGGSSYWIPTFDESLFTFNLDVTLRNDWNVVSQGTRTLNNPLGEQREVRYESTSPDEEAYLIAGPFTEYEKPAGKVAVQAFLRTPDEELADRYIDATSQYLNMYEKLIGPYPYTKFALVENFWETGYGMPSFTLLGEKVIRLPFILYTSYPHELLHNWWGNSVYVESDSGNWCEGLTAYMADHLLKEQEGQGAEYRQTTLQKFTDYVNESNDFPLVDFRSRNNSAEEAIGYGKCLMMNHMLRKKVGDELFIDSYRRFYMENRFKRATFPDIQLAFEAETEHPYGPFFNQWIHRKGAPDIKVSDVSSVFEDGLYKLDFTLAQVQPEDPFFLDIPVAIYYKDTVELRTVNMDLNKQIFTFKCEKKPLKIEIDPQFDVFRKLDKAEVPPALSQVFGSADALIVLPKASPFLEDYQQLADTWQKSQEAQGKKLEIVYDLDLLELPSNKSAWVLGFDNKFARVFNIPKDYGVVLGENNIKKIDELSKTGSLVYAIPNPSDNNYSLGFVATNVKEAVAGLGRLLPHYGKYSYLGFEGERPNNVLKGTFPALHSPLHVAILYDGKTELSKAYLGPEKPLIGKE